VRKSLSKHDSNGNANDNDITDVASTVTFMHKVDYAITVDGYNDDDKVILVDQENHSVEEILPLLSNGDSEDCYYSIME